MANLKEFFDAVSRGDVAMVKTMIDRIPEFVRAKHDGATPLHFAAINNRPEVVAVLIAHGADLHAQDDEYSAMPIGWANEKGHTEMVEYLLRKGTVLTLNRAAAYGCIDRVRELLLDEDSQVNMIDGYGAPIHEASLWGHPEIVDLLLAHGANPDIKNRDGLTAFAIAKRQMDSGGKGTPIVIETKRQEIVEGCRAVIEALRDYGAMEH